MGTRPGNQIYWQFQNAERVDLSSSLRGKVIDEIYSTLVGQAPKSLIFIKTKDGSRFAFGGINSARREFIPYNYHECPGFVNGQTIVSVEAIYRVLDDDHSDNPRPTMGRRFYAYELHITTTGAGKSFIWTGLENLSDISFTLKRYVKGRQHYDRCPTGTKINCGCKDGSPPNRCKFIHNYTGPISSENNDEAVFKCQVPKTYYVSYNTQSETFHIKVVEGREDLAIFDAESFVTEDFDEAVLECAELNASVAIKAFKDQLSKRGE